MDFNDGMNIIMNRIKELIVKLDNNEEDLDVLEAEFIELQSVLIKLENKIEEEIEKKKEE